MQMKGKKKRLLAAGMAFFMTAPSILGNMAFPVWAAPEEGTVEVPKPYYEFTFDEEIQNNKVLNIGVKNDVTATIEGKGAGLGIVEDTERSSKVLNLPGDGLNQGYLTLPDNMFADVGESGFAFSFWIKIDQSASHYNRIFSASPIALNSNDGDGGRWNAPEFTFVVGGTDTSNSRYNSSIMLSDRANQAKLIWDEAFTKEKWQHVTISVDPSKYDIYLDGQGIGAMDGNNNLTTVLGKMFENNCQELKGYTNNAIGRSVYSTDNDIKAKIDEFRFYNTALTDAQAQAAYEEYQVDTTVMQQLTQKTEEAKAKSISLYTKQSYDALREKIKEAEEVIANPVTEANVQRMLGELETAIGALAYYEGIDENTAFSNAQLTKELPIAKELLKEPLSEESIAALQSAVSQSEAALAKKEQTKEVQKEVDDALKALRTAVEEANYGATLRFDASGNTGDMLHGSTGFLYGVSEPNVPSADLLEAISPKILVQKAADGKQHPSGDGYRLTSFLEECGVENVQIYLQDYYLQWPYESNGIDDYNEVVKTVVTKMLDGKSQEEIEKYSFVIFNEPDQIWYGGRVNQMCSDWEKIYTTIKEISPYAKVAGPNFAGYRSNDYETFFQFASENNCLPEYITWHELQKDKLTSYKSHYDHVKGLVETYYKDSGIEPILFVNETVNFEDVGAPGPLVNWISIFEETKVYASLPYWGLANSMNELAADTNKPNGAWWVYKWYADMNGYTIPMEKENIEAPSSYGSLYGLSSVDEKNNMIQTIFGGQAGTQSVSIDNIRKLPAFENADAAHVKIYSTKYTGHHGFADEIPVEFEGDVALRGESLVFSVKDAALMDAYYALITPAGKESAQDNKTEAKWTQTYEAENAQLLGAAKDYAKTGGSDLARSNRAEVGNLNTENDGVKFQVEVPKDGTYRLNVYYSSQAPQVDPLTLEYVDSNGQNRAIGAISSHSLTVDGELKEVLEYESTVKWGYYNYKTVYLPLSAGSHDITLMYKGESQNGKPVESMLCALLDKIDLTYEENPDTKTVITEPEEAVGRNAGYSFSNEGDNYHGAGYANGCGAFDFYVNAPQEGYYAMNISAKGAGNLSVSKSSVTYAQDAKAESDVAVTWLPLGSAAVGSEAFAQVQGPTVYLTAGINQILMESTAQISLDQVVFSLDSQATQDGSYTMEAEEAVLFGNQLEDDYTYLPGSKANPEIIENGHASKEKAVEGFRGGADTDNKLTFQVVAPAAGNYKLSMFYSNNEPAPVMKDQSGENYVHPYNTDLVERYAQIRVNDQAAQTVYFRNTLCWDVFKNVVMDVTLQEGENTIVISNDNSYKFSSVQDDFTPRFDKFIIAPATYASAVNPPAEKELTEIKVKSMPEKTEYAVGEVFEAKGLVVEAVYSDSSTKELTEEEYTLSGFDSSKAGEVKVTVSYEGKSAEFTVTVNDVTEKELTEIKITSMPEKTEYAVGEAFEAKGLEVEAVYSDNSTKELTKEEYILSGFDSSKAGEITVSVSYEGKSAEFTVKVIAVKELKKIKVSHKPEKTKYYLGEELDTKGLAVQAVYSDGSKKEIQDYSLSGFDSKKTGKQTITVTYEGKTAKFTVRVREVKLKSITVTPPAKTTYQVGEELDITGMKVMGLYSDKKEAEIKDYEISDLDSTKAGKKKIVVTFQKKADSFTVEVVKKLQEEESSHGKWVLDNTGWWYQHSDKSWSKNGWELINGHWYLFNENGYMETGWKRHNNTWYYLNSNGDMATGWVLEGDKWYYMNESGAMQFGWIDIGGKWYYLNESGAMQSGWLYVGGSWYYLNESGAMQTGWYLVGGTWYYSDRSGAMASETWVGNYYVNASGAWVRSR